MNLLLLLSALLSAMTGVGAGVRGSSPAAAVVRQVDSLAAETVRARVAQRPATGLPKLGDVSAAGIVPVSAPVAPAPLHLTRLRV